MDNLPTQFNDVHLMPLTIYESSRGWLSLNLREVWNYRELLVFLTWRDIKVRYAQAALGAAWAILQPLLTMVIFGVNFGQLAQLPSDGIPYPVFSYVALLPWQLFAGALQRAGTSLVGNSNLLTKVYFPRLIIPISAVAAGLVDFAIGFVVLFGLMLFYNIKLTRAVLVVRPSERIKVIPTSDGKVIRAASGLLDTTRHLAEVKYHLRRISGDKVVSEIEESHQMRYFFPNDWIKTYKNQRYD